MILPFSTKFKDGTATDFTHKIQLSIGCTDCEHTQDLSGKNISSCNSCWRHASVSPKKHTIREDVHDRWHAGRMIHPVINNRSKNQFQFAPAFPCVSTQKIEIQKTDDKIIIAHHIDCRWGFAVAIDGEYVNNDTVKSIALNDGFTTVDSFFKWFNKDFTGKIIHWTDLKY